MEKTDEQCYLEDSKALKADFEKYMFHPMRDKVFAGLLLNKSLCEQVITAVTGVPFAVRDVFAQYHEHGELNQGRTIILDIKALDSNGAACDIEVQVKYYIGGAHEKRAVFHGGRLMSKQLRSGEYFDKVRPVIVIFFNFESASKHFIRHVGLRDDMGVLYSDVFSLHEVNTMEHGRASADQVFVKIFSYFLLYACEREKLFKKLEAAGVDPEHETIKMLIQLHNELMHDPKAKEDLKLMEMTAEDKIFLVGRNFFEVREQGREEGREEGRVEILELVRKGYSANEIEEFIAVRR